jgi:hypothetical protein
MKNNGKKKSVQAQIPVGYVAKAAREDETSTTVVFREFLSFEDGMELIQRLEGFPDEVLSKIGDEAGLKSSQIDHMLVHIDREGTFAYC